jgi:DeoR/GlpR family transcriptional regulator of sugar metabolism
MKSKLPSEARQSKICERFAKQPGATISDLAREFSVSEMTIRRDLAALEKTAGIRRTHGGAVLTERMVLEFDYRERRALNRAEKLAIASKAASLVEPGSRIILDTGTTTLELACLLRDMSNLTVVTPSLAVASELQHSPGVEVILLGGVVRHGSPDLTGAVTEHCLDLFQVDIAFQGAEGIGLDGSLYDRDLQLARVDKQMRQVAKKTCLLADHTKIGLTALARSGSIKDVDIFITDSGAPRSALEKFTRLGVQVLVAK